jgi:hypothetical protein
MGGRTDAAIIIRGKVDERSFSLLSPPRLWLPAKVNVSCSCSRTANSTSANSDIGGNDEGDIPRPKVAGNCW